jgi:hypothetical protein
MERVQQWVFVWRGYSNGSSCMEGVYQWVQLYGGGIAMGVVVGGGYSSRSRCRGGVER